MTTNVDLRAVISQESEGQLRHIWSECVGAGRANEALRADWRYQFEEACGSAGFKRVRFHGLYHDDMFVYRTTYGGGFGPDATLEKPVIAFSYVDKVFDYLLSTGAKPFVEFGFMPEALATKKKTLFWWGAHCSPPNDMSEWARLVDATVRHWIGRYGRDEVRTWKFEVWNEPNLVPFFWTGTKSEYFELYRSTVETVKRVDPHLQVGGPATSVFVPDDRYKGETENRSAMFDTASAEDVDRLDWRPVWVEEFLDWCAEQSLPVDFLTTHLYPTDTAFGKNGEARAIFRHVDATSDDLKLLKDLVDESPFSGIPIHVTEWSSSPSSRDFMHDSVCAATYIVRAYLKCADLVDSLSYWTFTDIFEEGGGGIGPFHGGFGILTEGGIKKPTYHAFAGLNRLGDEILAQDDAGIVTRDSLSRCISAIVVNYPAAMGRAPIGSARTFAETKAVSELGSPRWVRIQVEGLKPGTVFCTAEVGKKFANPAQIWWEMGAPVNLSPEQEQVLREAGESVRYEREIVGEDGALRIDRDLEAWSVLSVWQEQSEFEEKGEQ